MPARLSVILINFINLNQSSSPINAFPATISLCQPILWETTRLRSVNGKDFSLLDFRLKSGWRLFDRLAELILHNVISDFLICGKTGKVREEGREGEPGTVRVLYEVYWLNARAGVRLNSN